MTEKKLKKAVLQAVATKNVVRSTELHEILKHTVKVPAELRRPQPGRNISRFEQLVNNFVSHRQFPELISYTKSLAGKHVLLELTKKGQKASQEAL